MTTSNKVLILLDADVIIHLFKAERISLLNELFSGRLRMLDVVHTELLNNRSINQVVENLFVFKQIEEIAFPTTTNQAMFFEYLKLKPKIKGDGERASLLYCKYYKQIIASSNTSDIVPFCNENSIAFLTTLDILSIAIHRKKITNQEANDCIRMILSKGSHLCCTSIEEHLRKHFETEKLLY